MPLWPWSLWELAPWVRQALKIVPFGGNLGFAEVSQMWNLPGLNVESHVDPLRSPWSEVVAHRPPRPLVHLFEISGPVRSFFSFFCLFSGISCACRRAVGGSGCAGRFGGAGIGFPGALTPTVRGLLSAPGAGRVPSRAVPVRRGCRRGCFCGSAGDSWAWPERWAFGFGFFRP